MEKTKKIKIWDELKVSRTQLSVILYLILAISILIENVKTTKYFGRWIPIWYDRIMVTMRW